MPVKVTWAYGVTTVPRRREDLLPRTLASLAAAGFDKPRLFCDGADGPDWTWYRQRFGGLEVTCHSPALRTHGNWVLSLYELFVREPTADRYAVFQDDLVAVKNLRAYLERRPPPDGQGYANLYTFPQNESLIREKRGEGYRGWCESNQRGRGAVALVFSREAALFLLSSRHMLERPMDAHRGWKSVDGGIVTAFVKAGRKEYVHTPSLVQHTGDVSTMRNRAHPKAPSFPGEDFDALTLLSCPEGAVTP